MTALVGTIRTSSLAEGPPFVSSAGGAGCFDSGLRHQSAPERRSNSHSSSRWLRASPYAGREHLLDLQTVDIQSQLFAIALTYLKPATEHYATTTYENSLDWLSLMAELKTLAERANVRWRRQEFYVVEFRSKLFQEIDNDLLFQLDQESHREATESGGLLKYWYGRPDSERRNLATCLWRSKNDAIKGGQGPWHKQARAIIPKMYDTINVRGLRLIIEDDARSWRFEPYQ